MPSIANGSRKPLYLAQIGLSVHTARKVPRPILRAADLIGDLITALTGKPFYITSSRYRSMVTNYVAPMDKTYTFLGQPKMSLAQGVQGTLAWLRTRPGFEPA